MDDDTDMEDSESCGSDEVTDEDDDTYQTMSVSARPRRLSELKIPDKVNPMPKASSLFVFSSTNR